MSGIKSASLSSIDGISGVVSGTNSINGTIGSSYFIINDYLLEIVETANGYDLNISRGSQTQTAHFENAVSIESIRQIESSEADHGRNTLRIALNNGEFADFYFYNGSTGPKGDPVVDVQLDINSLFFQCDTNGITTEATTYTVEFVAKRGEEQIGCSLVDLTTESRIGNIEVTIIQSCTANRVGKFRIYCPNGVLPLEGVSESGHYLAKFGFLTEGEVKIIKAVQLWSILQGESGGGADITPATTSSLGGVIVGDHLDVTGEGRLSVHVVDNPEEDNTNPITAAAVYTEIGNINALLAII